MSERTACCITSNANRFRFCFLLSSVLIKTINVWNFCITICLLCIKNTVCINNCPLNTRTKIRNRWRVGVFMELYINIYQGMQKSSEIYNGFIQKSSYFWHFIGNLHWQSIFIRTRHSVPCDRIRIRKKKNLSWFRLSLLFSCQMISIWEHEVMFLFSNSNTTGQCLHLKALTLICKCSKFQWNFFCRWLPPSEEYLESFGSSTM